MSKIIQFKKINQEKIKKQFELEDCDEALLDLAEKLIHCNPSRDAAKKKDEIKAAYLKKAEEYRKNSKQPQELSDEDLDAAAGGILRLEDTMDPLNDK